MGEFKFRAWDKRSRLMTTHFALIDGKPMRKNYNGIYFVETELEVMQFIGRRDKNKKEIFDRDIIKVIINSGEDGFYYREVVWNNKEASFDFGECEMIGHSNLDYEIEVVGNIFENPELVENGRRK